MRTVNLSDENWLAAKHVALASGLSLQWPGLEAPTFGLLIDIEIHYLRLTGWLGRYPVYGETGARRVAQQELAARIRWRLAQPRRVLPLP